ncbi:MAG: adenylate/guanylate cyclase domain-containing protein [Spirochaetaceae bacterium]
MGDQPGWSSRDGEQNWEEDLRRQIEDYYLPQQLIDTIMAHGGIIKGSVVATMGIGFLDIADYTYISRFLSPQENQDILNGLYTAFHGVLKRHGGYLNKIEGDSVMFHYGGPTDSQVPGDQGAAVRYIAKELFYTCVELQRVAERFNKADESFFAKGESSENRGLLERAFDIMSRLRHDETVSEAFKALFQIRVRIGANVGEVTVGNFGPAGAKQWDIVGLPVIEAKRMEATAPVGGLRISKYFYQVLEDSRIADEYFYRFRREAEAYSGYYRSIDKTEVFQYSTVLLQDKKDARFETYSVQVSPGLPESILGQVESLLEKGPAGADRIIDILKYYRGNRFVTTAIEEGLVHKKVRLRKLYMFELIFPRKYELIKRRLGDPQEVERFIEREYSLFDLFHGLGRYQDTVKTFDAAPDSTTPFQSYEQYMQAERRRIEQDYQRRKRYMLERAYFYNVVFPLVFASIRTSVLEYQAQVELLEAV